jgi:hypothetical protein
MRHLPLALVLTLFLISSAASRAEASFAPASVSLGLGYSNGLGPELNSYTPAPSLSALWPLMSHVSVFSAVSYLQHRSAQPNRALASTGYPSFPVESGTRRSHFVPIAAGIRLSVGTTTRSHGLFVEAGPAAYLASLDSGKEEVLLGFQAGGGVRFRAFGASHAELGMSFYRSGSTAASDDPWAASPDPEGVNAYTLYATVGLSP